MQFSGRFSHVRQSGVTLMTPLDGRRIDLETPPNGNRFFPAVLIHQRGFTELEMQQHCADLPLLGLKRAVEQLETEGKVHRMLADVGSYRIALPDVLLEDIPIGYNAAYQ